MTYNVFSGTLNPTHSHSRYFVSDWDPFAEDLGIESDCDTEEEIRRFAFVVLTVQHCSLEMSVCLSVCLSVRPSVHLSIGPSSRL